VRLHTEQRERASSVNDQPDIDILHEIGRRIVAADPLQTILDHVVHVFSSAVRCDSCFIYVLDEESLVPRAWKAPHAAAPPGLRPGSGQGAGGWIAGERQPVAVGGNVRKDPRFEASGGLLEPECEAFLSAPVLWRGRLVGLITAQHRQPHQHSRREIRLMSLIGLLLGAEIELARLEIENTQLSEQLEARKVIDRAKGILQRDLGLTEEDAYLTIQRQSRQRRKAKREIAEAIILGDEVRRQKKS
jgi:uroporphyrinogen-III synthase